MDAAIRVLLVDDQELIRTGFALILSTAPGIEVVGEVGDGDAALRTVSELASEERLPQVVLMDVRMPGVNGIEATRRLVEQYPAVRVIVLTTFDLDEYAISAVEAGASGFMLKDARAAELIAAVRAVAEGDLVMAPSVTRRLLTRLRTAAPMETSEATPAATSAAVSAVTAAAAKPAGDALEMLTEREREVFVLIAEGLSNAEIGERLYLSASTVKTHVGRVLAKLELRDRVHAVIFAYESGVLPAGGE